MKRIAKLLVGFLALATPVVYAHPGHGVDDGNMPLHYLASPEHLISLLLIVAFVLYVRYRIHTKQNT